MQSVNLARRPFVNRRPVLRLAILLWIAGVALTVHNLSQYLGHWQGTATNRERLAAVGAEVREEQAKLGDLDQQLARVSLERENIHAQFLNRLIAYRTFPWSALFDDLEEVIPLDVKLHSVKPDVNLKAEPEKPASRRRSRRSRRASAAATPPVTTATESGDSSAAETADAPKAAAEPLRRDEVRLQLNGVAKSEDAVVELIEVLYASPYFRSPFLPGETLNSDGSVKFNVSTVYLTRSTAVPPEAAGEEGTDPVEAAVAELGAGATAEAETDRTENAGASAATSSDTPGRPAVTAGQAGTGTSRPASGDPASGVPASGDAVARGTSSRGSPASRESASRDATARGTAAGEARATDPRRRRRAAVPRSRLGATTLPGLAPVAAVPGTETPAGGGGTPPAGTPSSTPAGTPNASQPPPSEEPEFAQPAASGTPAVGPGAWLTPGQLWRPADAAPAPLAYQEARA